MHFGPEDILGALSVDFADTASSIDVETSISDLERNIKAEFPQIKRLFIEAQSVLEHAKSIEVADIYKGDRAKARPCYCKAETSNIALASRRASAASTDSRNIARSRSLACTTWARASRLWARWRSCA